MFALLVSILPLALAVPAAWGQPAEARDTLEQASLVNRGTLWMLPAEERLRRDLERLDPLARAIRTAEKRVAALIEQNESRRRELERHKSILKQLTDASQDTRRTAEQRELLKKQAETVKARVAEWERLYLAPPVFAAHEAVRQEVIELIDARGRLALLCLRLPELHEEVEAAYRELNKQEAIRRALATLGPEQRLGTGRDYGRVIDRLEEYWKLSVAGDVPLYRLAGHDRVGVIINHRAPATCTWSPEAGMSYLPASLLRRAGVAIPADAPQVELTVGDRRLRGPRVRLPSLRLGDREAVDVDVVALPPEAADLGSVLFTGSISNLRAMADYARLRLVFPE